MKQAQIDKHVRVAERRADEADAEIAKFTEKIEVAKRAKVRAEREATAWQAHPAEDSADPVEQPGPVVDEAASLAPHPGQTTIDVPDQG